MLLVGVVAGAIILPLATAALMSSRHADAGVAIGGASWPLALSHHPATPPPIPLAGPTSASAMPSPPTPTSLPAPDEDSFIDSYIDIRQVEGRINAAKAKRLAQLLDRYPDRAADVVRRWLAEDFVNRR
jgi:flagellar biosynthesis/type III secretory pathway M-ring protein FliF/YscJ